MEYNIVRPVITQLDHRVFNYMLNQPLGRALVDWLCREINIRKMIDICKDNNTNKNKRAALEALDSDIYKEFVDPLVKMERKEIEKWKQFIGYIVRIIMEANNLSHQKCTPINNGKLFSNASIYILN